MQGDLDLCAREEDETKFLATVKKLALQRSVSERTVMVWCYLRGDSPEAIERIKGWIEKQDASGKWLMDLPTYEIEE